MRATIAREPEGTWTAGGRLEDGSLQGTTGQVNASSTSFFSSDFEKMSIDESDVRKSSLMYKQQVGVYMNVSG